MDNKLVDSFQSNIQYGYHGAHFEKSSNDTSSETHRPNGATFHQKQVWDKENLYFNENCWFWII